MQLLIPIERTDGSVITDAEKINSVPEWKLDIRGKGSSQSINWDAIINDEPHHRFYGRPWILGRHYFDGLIHFGVRPSDRVLDVGCGAGRVTTLLAPYLQEGHYFGIDAHLASLAIMSAYEAFIHGLGRYKIRLLHDDNFSACHFGTKFDVALDFFTTTWVQPKRERSAALNRIAESCRDGARLFSLSEIPPTTPWVLVTEKTIGPNDWRVFAKR